MRDSTFTLQALHYLLLDWEADDFMQFLADPEPTEDGSLQIMYGIDGHRDLTEATRDELSGYEGAHPVRVGNGAWNQKQNDVFGAVLDSILLHARHSQRLPRRLWPIAESQAECAIRVWKNPDQGIWEARGAPKQYVSSKLMCWVALDVRPSWPRSPANESDGMAPHGHEIRADILAHGVSDQGVLRRTTKPTRWTHRRCSPRSSASYLADDERLVNTVNAIADELTENGFVLRYLTGETDDGMSGKEGTFLICSFWLVSALAIVGEITRARNLMEKFSSLVATRPLR